MAMEEIKSAVTRHLITVWGEDEATAPDHATSMINIWDWFIDNHGRDGTAVDGFDSATDALLRVFFKRDAEVNRLLDAALRAKCLGRYHQRARRVI
jgi:hypothetical protein